MSTFESCPRFRACSCNVCPLDPLSALHGGPRVALAGEESCRASRAVREAVATAHGFPPTWALLPREIRRDKAKARWAALPAAEQERRVAKLTPKTAHGERRDPFLTRVREGDGASGCPDKGAAS